MNKKTIERIFEYGETSLLEYLERVKAFPVADREKVLLEIQAEAIVEMMMGTDKLYLYRLNELEKRVKETIPDSLNKEQDEAIIYYEVAVSAGVLERTVTGYRRKGILKAQLAYFLGRIHTPDATGKDGRVFPETALNALFGETRLGQALRRLADNKNGGGKPRGYERIDNILKKAESLIHDQQKAPQK